MAEDEGGPWGRGGKRGPGDRGGHGGRDGGPGGNRGGGGRGFGPPPPEIDDLVRKGQERLRVLIGGRVGGGGGGGGAPGGPGGLGISRNMVLLGLMALAVIWLFLSVYRVQNYEQSVELFFGQFHAVRGEGLNFAPWPVITKEKVTVTREETEYLGGARSDDDGLMLTGDENVVDVDYQVVWNIADPAKYLFTLRDPGQTIRAVAESAMREIIAQSELAPILNRDRDAISNRLEELIQSTLDSYDSGVNIVRVNFDKADPPPTVIDAFRDVQAAAQERDRLQNVADAYRNRVLAEARGQAAQIREEAEGYRARVVNEAEGEASRFSAVREEYAKAPEVTRKRLYLETMERVLGDVNKIILEETGSGQGVVPYLPLNELRPTGAVGATDAQGGN